MSKNRFRDLEKRNRSFFQEIFWGDICFYWIGQLKSDRKCGEQRVVGETVNKTAHTEVHRRFQVSFIKHKVSLKPPGRGITGGIRYVTGVFFLRKQSHNIWLTTSFTDNVHAFPAILNWIHAGWKWMGAYVLMKMWPCHLCTCWLFAGIILNRVQT